MARSARPVISSRSQGRPSLRRAAAPSSSPAEVAAISPAGDPGSRPARPSNPGVGAVDRVRYLGQRGQQREAGFGLARSRAASTVARQVPSQTQMNTERTRLSVSVTV